MKLNGKNFLNIHSQWNINKFRVLQQVTFYHKIMYRNVEKFHPSIILHLPFKFQYDLFIKWNVFSFFFSDIFLHHIAKYILPCSRTDPQINQCIKKSFNHLKPFLGKGLPELNVPALEPLVVEQMNMDNDAGAVRIKARFSEIAAKGASNYTVREVRSDVKVQFYFYSYFI